MSLRVANPEGDWPSGHGTILGIPAPAISGKSDSPFREAQKPNSVYYNVVHRLAYNGDVVAFKMGRRQGAP
jgi:hypothetical protein